MKRFVCIASLMAAIVFAAVSGSKAQYAGSPTNNPPFLKGNYGSSVSGTTISFGFRGLNGYKRYWGYTYVVTSGYNVSNVTVKYMLKNALRSGTETVTTMRLITLGPGGSIADYVACDSIYVTKATATDSVYYGGYYNR